MHLSETKHLLFTFTNSSFWGNIWLRSSDTCVPYSGTRVHVCSGSHSASSDADPERQQVAAHPEAPCHSLARAELCSRSGFGPIQFQLLEVLAEWPVDGSSVAPHLLSLSFPVTCASEIILFWKFLHCLRICSEAWIDQEVKIDIVVGI